MLLPAIYFSYVDLLQHFEEFSMGDDNFTLFILLGAYGNQRLLDGLQMKCTVWAPNRDIVRQITTKRCDGVRFVLRPVLNGRLGMSL